MDAPRVRRDLDPAHHGQVAGQPQALELRPVVRDEIVVRRDRDIDPLRNDALDSLGDPHGAVRVRRVHVRVEGNQPGGVNGPLHREREVRLLLTEDLDHAGRHGILRAVGGDRQIGAGGEDDLEPLSGRIHRVLGPFPASPGGDGVAGKKIRRFGRRQAEERHLAPDRPALGVPDVHPEASEGRRLERPGPFRTPIAGPKGLLDHGRKKIGPDLVCPCRKREAQGT